MYVCLCVFSFRTDEVKTSRSSGFTSSNEDFKCEPPATPLKDEDSTDVQPDDGTPSPEILPVRRDPGSAYDTWKHTAAWTV